MKNKSIYTGTIFIWVMMCVFSFAGFAVETTNIPDAMTVIHTRKSVRNFTGETVTKEQLTAIVKAGMAAPTAVNRQPWSFVIVTKPEQLKALAGGLPYAKMLDKAGAAIVVCALPEEAYNKSTEYAILDASCASENILLAIEAMGLGGVWTAAYPDPDRMIFVRKVLGIPENVIPLNVIPVGRPTGADQPKDKYRPELMHWEKW
ncbi:MAG TPA: nitroreductase family protein [Candidatus Omnitrophota bacterium]|nr:nitroreductase family protein [Candidatus Omnitrophota bacterium]HPS19704.1 nitroreductase family protein [Candidatus Omnitrophota bacterium]